MAGKHAAGSSQPQPPPQQPLRQPAVTRAVAPGESSDFTPPATDGTDWRVSVYLNVPGAAPRRRRALSAHEVENELRQRVRGRVALQTHDRDAVFVYTHTQDATAEAQQAASDLLAERSIPAQVVVERWHPIAQQWELPEAPLPADEAAERAERTLLDAAETRESLAFGAAMYDVRVKLPSHREVVELAASLAAEGYSVVRRWAFSLSGRTTPIRPRNSRQRFGSRHPKALSCRSKASSIQTRRGTTRSRLADITGGPVSLRPQHQHLHRASNRGHCRPDLSAHPLVGIRARIGVTSGRAVLCR